jgi:hypothetical protein
MPDPTAAHVRAAGIRMRIHTGELTQMAKLIDDGKIRSVANYVFSSRPRPTGARAERDARHASARTPAKDGRTAPSRARKKEPRSEVVPGFL